MKFYQENKINPLASCLPLLLQLPVFISLFYMLRTDLKKHICGDAARRAIYNADCAPARRATSRTSPTCRPSSSNRPAASRSRRSSAKFLFIPDITNKATGVALIVLIVLYVGSQLASTLIATATADPNQRRLMLLLPVVFVVILYRYPAGLLVYWITTNLWTIGQQYFIRRHMGPPPADGRDAAEGGPPTAKPTRVAASRRSPRRRRRRPAPAARRRVGASRPAPPPPPPPRKKKKRSGRRR